MRHAGCFFVCGKSIKNQTNCLQMHPHPSNPTGVKMNEQLVCDVERNSFSPVTLRSALLTVGWCHCVHA